MLDQGRIWIIKVSVCFVRWWPRKNFKSSNRLIAKLVGGRNLAVYAYDADGNMTSLFTATQGVNVEKILTDNIYKYDKNGNRTEKKTLAGTTEYTYDAQGNILNLSTKNEVTYE